MWQLVGEVKDFDSLQKPSQNEGRGQPLKEMGTLSWKGLASSRVLSLHPMLALQRS